MKAGISAPLTAMLLAAGCMQGVDVPAQRDAAAFAHAPVPLKLDWILRSGDEEEFEDDEEDEDPPFWPWW